MNMIKEEPKYKLLSNGIKIPELAFGTFRLDNSEESIEIVYNAIKCGYRHIDTAFDYGCETAVGLGIKRAIDEGIVKREDLFVTTKVLSTEQGFDSTLKNFQQSLENLGLDYVDLYLIHHPRYDSKYWQKYTIDTWRAFETLYKKGKVNAIGVSNFQPWRLEYLIEEAEIKPMINQIEIHPQHQQKEAVDFCRKHNILLSAWGALNQGRIFNVDLFKKLSKKYNRTISQIALRWSLQKGYIPISFADNVEFIKSNLDVYDFNISEEDMKYFDILDNGAYSGWHNDKQTKSTYEYLETVKLFTLIPICKIVRNDNKIKYLLFGIIPILKINKEPLSTAITHN